METNINIAKILKNVSIDTKLYSPLFGDVFLKYIGEMFITVRHHGTVANFYHNGRLYDYEGTEPMLLPSREMRDWSKFSWKRGDILVKTDNSVRLIFAGFNYDSYTSFTGKHVLDNEYLYYDKVNCIDTDDFIKASDDVAQTYINTLEKKLEGKLNRETLEVEKAQPEFKDGYIVCISGMGYLAYGIVKSIDYSSKKLEYYVLNDMSTLKFEDWLSFEDKQIQPITETQQIILFDALAKKGKDWDAEKKAIVDLPKKCEFKAMVWCLMRDKKETWKLCQFSFFDDGDYEAPYNAVGGNWFDECIPYNEETKHLLGTTDEWKGGEG